MFTKAMKTSLSIYAVLILAYAVWLRMEPSGATPLLQRMEQLGQHADDVAKAAASLEEQARRVAQEAKEMADAELLRRSEMLLESLENGRGQCDKSHRLIRKLQSDEDTQRNFDHDRSEK